MNQPLPLPGTYKIPENWDKIVLRKHKSPHTIVIEKDYAMSDDGWFVRFKYCKKERVIESCLLILKDVEQHIDYHYRQGWVEVESLREIKAAA